MAASIAFFAVLAAGCKLNSEPVTTVKNDAAPPAQTSSASDEAAGCGAPQVTGVNPLDDETRVAALQSMSNGTLVASNQDDPGSGRTPTSGDTKPDTAIALTDSCADVCRDIPLNYTGGDETQRGNWAACFSCRCKQALVEIPSPEEIRCSSATGPLQLHRAVLTEGRVTGTAIIDPNSAYPGSTRDCLNGGIAASYCDRQSRFKRMIKNSGKTEYQMLCRKHDTTNAGYYEYLLIGHNTDNGATCFWQARNTSFNGEATVQLDLTGANNTAENRRAYGNTMYTYSEGPSQCTECHASDAFIWSPHLASAWPLARARNDELARKRWEGGPYKLVTTTSAEPQTVTKTQLADAGGPLENACGRCHKVAKTSGYCSMSMKATGLGAESLNTPEALQHARTHLFWMPPGSSGHAVMRGHQAAVQTACR